MKLSSLYSARTFFSSGIEFVRMEWFTGVIKRSNWSISWSGLNKNGIKAGSDINFRNIKLFDRDWFNKKSLLCYKQSDPQDNRLILIPRVVCNDFLVSKWQDHYLILKNYLERMKYFLLFWKKVFVEMNWSSDIPFLRFPVY